MDTAHGNAAGVRAFRVLEAVAQHADGCTPAQVVLAVGLPKQTVHRLVSQLVHGGLLVREPRTRRLQLAERVERFALAALVHGSARTERRGILQRLVADLGETCNLAALAGTDVVYLDRVEAAWPLRQTLAPGSRVPAHATSSGKLLLSLLPRAQRERLLARLPLRGFTEATIVRRDALERELVETRRRRVGINRSEHLRGLCGVAVPVMADRQRACAAVALQAPASRMPLEAMLAHLPRLREAAREMRATFDA